jgi:hypothetical protein
MYRRDAPTNLSVCKFFGSPTRILNCRGKKFSCKIASFVQFLSVNISWLFNTLYRIGVQTSAVFEHFQNSAQNEITKYENIAL